MTTEQQIRDEIRRLCKERWPEAPVSIGQSEHDGFSAVYAIVHSNDDDDELLHQSAHLGGGTCFDALYALRGLVKVKVAE